MKRIKILMICLVCCLCCYAQYKYTGKVIDSEGEPIAFVNIVLLNAADSTYITGEISDVDGFFNFTNENSGILKIWQNGYQEKYLNNPHGENLTITLDEAVNQLNEVVVTTSRVVSRFNGDAISTSIRGTVLEHFGSAKEVLVHVPSVINNQGSIEVIGKGLPLIYINGKLMRNDNELDMLKSERIKSIEVIRNPGAKYDATAKAVILISTDRTPGDGIAIDNTSKINYRDAVGGSEDLGINYRHNSLDLFADFAYSGSKRNVTNISEQNTWLSKHGHQEVVSSQKYKNHDIDAKIGFDYSLGENHSLGAYYEITHTPMKIVSLDQTTGYIDGATDAESLVDMSYKDKVTTHYADAYYRNQFGKWSLDAAFDAMWINGINDIGVSENNSIENQSLFSTDKNKRQLFAGKAIVSYPVLEGNLDLGIEYTNSKTTEIYVADNVFDNVAPIIKENSLGVFAETSQTFGIVQLQVGVRYEHINSRYYEYGVKIEEQSRIYNKLFPSATAMLPIGKTQLQLSYSYSYDRPLYSQLSSAIIYTNQYQYSCGNPKLQPQYNHKLSANIKYRWLMLMLDYTQTSDMIISQVASYNDSDAIALITKTNLSSNAESLQAMINLSPSFGKHYNMNLLGGLIAPFIDIEYRGEPLKLRSPLYIIKSDNIFSLGKNFTINADIDFMSSGNSEIMKVGGKWSINLGVQKDLGNWRVKLAVDDIFNTAKNFKLTMYSGNYDYTQAVKYRSRKIEFAVRYIFNTSASKYLGTGAGNNEKARMM